MASAVNIWSVNGTSPVGYNGGNPHFGDMARTNDGNLWMFVGTDNRNPAHWQIIAMQSTSGGSVEQGVDVKDEGNLIKNNAQTLNFIGGSVSASTSGSTVNINVSGGSSASSPFEYGSGANSAQQVGTDSQSNGINSVAKGSGTTANSEFSETGGLESVANRYGENAVASGKFTDAGDAQYSTVIARAEGVGVQELFLDGISEKITIPTNSICNFNISLLAIDMVTNEVMIAQNLFGVIKNISNTTTLVEQNSAPILLGDGAMKFNWINNISANNTLDTLDIAFEISGNSNLVRWVAKIDLVETII